MRFAVFITVFALIPLASQAEEASAAARPLSKKAKKRAAKEAAAKAQAEGAPMAQFSCLTSPSPQSGCAAS